MVMNATFLILRPLSLVHIFLLIGLRSMALATLFWWQLVKLFIDFHVKLCWNILVLGITFATLPLKILTAIQREAKLERLLGEMGMQLESLVWENKEIEGRLQIVIKERDFIETAMEEIEEEHEKALARIALLENELEELKVENMRLNEGQGKVFWNYKARDDKDVNVAGAGSPVIDHGSPSSSRRLSYNMCSLILGNPSDTVEKGDTLERQRIIALSRSLFSALLSLLVGMIVWEAEDPCVPLVVALFTVVGMSLSSALEFFSTIKNKPASDAVALLSINWFILGTLTSPTLPSIAYVFAPRLIILADQMITWLGFAP